jgi:hypothetical protein
MPSLQAAFARIEAFPSSACKKLHVGSLLWPNLSKNKGLTPIRNPCVSALSTASPILSKK